MVSNPIIPDVSDEHRSVDKSDMTFVGYDAVMGIARGKQSGNILLAIDVEGSQVALEMTPSETIAMIEMLQEAVDR